VVVLVPLQSPVLRRATKGQRAQSRVVKVTRRAIVNMTSVGKLDIGGKMCLNLQALWTDVIGKDEMLICGSKHTRLDVHLGNQPRQLAMKRRSFETASG
jgi:hypothetical protein